MSGRGGCCIARHAGGGGGGGFIPYGMTKVERIMLKYRPIAPKPAAAGSGSGGSTTENSDGYVKCGRGKRKYVRVNKNKKKKKMIKEEDDHNNNKRKVSSSSPPPAASSPSSPPETLSLLPETPDRRENSPATDLNSPDLLKSCNCSNNMKKSSAAPVWLSFNGHVDGLDTVVIPSAPVQRRRVVSQVTVECVTDTWTGVEGLGCTDEERVMKMEVDTCPGFISDGQDRVVWANQAYREMVGVNGGENMSVVLVRKDKWTAAPPLTAVSYPAFTCKVKVSSAVQTGTPTVSSSPATLTLPCDGWRMKGGGCAWRLDVKAALSLGR